MSFRPFSSLRRVGRRASLFTESRARRRALHRLGKSTLFDPAWYLEAYADVRESGVDPTRHYLESGWREGRDPGPNFSTTAYLRANPDVAALGVNPLLHFIEHGHAEGRGLPEFGAPSRSSARPAENFGPAAPCRHFPVAEEPATPWIRAGGFEPDNRLVDVSGVTIGMVSAGFPVDRWEAAVRGLTDLSTWSEEPPSIAAFGTSNSTTIVDAWHAGRGIFRSRWSVEHGPVAVRAIQLGASGLQLVGEALVSSDLDVLDARLVDELASVMFVFASPDGIISDVRLVAFPALFRGGLHYAESLVLARGQSRFDLEAVDRRLLDQLLALRGGAVPALISSIDVDLKDSDGTHPLFQGAYQSWVNRRFGVAIAPALPAPQDESGRYLAECLKGQTPARPPAGSLRLAGNMVPSISALVAAEAPVGTSQKRGRIVRHQRSRTFGRCNLCASARGLELRRIARPSSGAAGTSAAGR